MPIKSIEVRNTGKNVTGVKIKKNSVGKICLTWKCQQAEAYLLCYKSGLNEWPDLEKMKEMLPEEKLSKLFSGKEVFRIDNLIFQGITVGTYNRFGGLVESFKNTPPIDIRIFCMIRNRQIRDGVDLYVPNDVGSESISISLDYRVDRDADGFCICMSEEGQAGYTDGAILYRVDSYAPIPVTKDWINKKILIPSSEEHIEIYVDSTVETQYNKIG